MGLWHVLYADWQMECCGTPFSVGDEVTWPLLLVPAEDMLGGWHDQLTKLVGPVEDVPGDQGAVRVLREETGFKAEPGAETRGIPAAALTALLETLSTVPGPSKGARRFPKRRGGPDCGP